MVVVGGEEGGMDGVTGGSEHDTGDGGEQRACQVARGACGRRC